MLKGLNHLTLAVSDIASSIGFYHHLLGLPLHARWDSGAYLSCGDLWLCLSLDAQRHYIAPQEATTPTMPLVSMKMILLHLWHALRKRGNVVEENKSEGASFIFSTRTGTSWKPTWAASRSGWPPAARSHTREWCF
jgi:catechol 2,3-dioxygenase-like lactoylglutathione lyase family enzyme